MIVHIRSNRTFLVGTMLSCLFLWTGLATAQTTTIQGRVTNAAGHVALEGVTITNLSMTVAARTDKQGNFNIRANAGDRLKVSLLGFKTLEIAVPSTGNLQIALNEESQQIDEVVVTALGIKRQTRGLTYATQQLEGSAVNDARDNSGNVLSSLTGKVAGAVVTTAATGPGASAKVVLRGNKSISGNNNALIVVDGIPYDNSSAQQATGTTYNYGTSDGAANINPDDIESINVLKGPSAAALYGSRAANGAILITTKQGKTGRYNIDYNGSASLDQVNLLSKFQNTYGRGNGGVSGTNVGESWGPQGQTYKNNVRNFFENANSFNNSVSTYGGTEKVQGYVSYTNNKIGGIIPGNELKRNNLNLRINTELIPKLKTDVKLNYVNQQIENRPRLGDMGIPVEVYVIPRDMDKDELQDFEDIDPVTGEPQRKYWSGSAVYDNPYWSTNRTSVNEVRDRITALGSASYQLTDWLNVMGRFSYDKYIDKTTGAFYAGTVSLGDVRPGGKYYETHARYQERNFDLLFNGNNTFNEAIKISYNVGASSLNREYSSFQNMANGLSVPNEFSLTMATTPEFLLVNGYQRRLNSVYGSTQLAFFNHTFLDMTARNDWTSTLKSPHSYFYPSVGVSSIFNEWLKLPAWISYGKLRASYTQVGNDANPYLLQQLYSFGLGAGKGFISRSPIKAIPELKPELTKSYEAGLDMKFFANRLGFDLTMYKSNTVNQLLFLGLPMASGFSRQYINAGNIANKGIEVQLTASPIKKEKLEWQTAFNFAANTNKVIELHERTKRATITENTKYASVVVNEGEKYGDLYGYKWKRHSETGKYVVDDSGLPVVEANQKLGNFNPKALLGWSNSVRYRDFTVNALIDTRIGGEIVSGTSAYLAAFGVADYTAAYRNGGLVLDAVDVSGAANTKTITAQQLWTRVSQNGRDAWGEFFTYDMTNVRLRELSVSYKFNLKNTVAIKSAQLMLTGRNLFFFYRGKSKLDIPGIGKTDSPIDPEAALGAGNFQGIEVGLPPTVRSFGLNVKLTF